MLRKVVKLGKQKLWINHREYIRNKHELTYLFWECTLNCNFKCKHCGSSAGGKILKETLSTKEIKDAFLDVATNFNAKNITIAVTGGEPLLRQDLFEVMKYARSLGFEWGMVTNGSLVNKDIVKKAKDAGMGSVDVSIDGIGKVHDDFRNTKGSYERAINAVKLFAEADFLRPLRISTTINRNNFNTLEEMYEIFTTTGAHEWRPIIVDPIGRALCNKEICLNKEEIITMLDFVKKKREQHPKLKISLGCAHYLGDEFEDEVRDHFFYCATGINVGSILHNGDIFVCPNVPRRKELIQGNIKKELFSKVWKERFKFFRDRERIGNDKCKDCEHWEECLGGSFHTFDMIKKEQKVCLGR